MYTLQTHLVTKEYAVEAWRALRLTSDAQRQQHFLRSARIAKILEVTVRFHNKSNYNPACNVFLITERERVNRVI